MDLNAVAVVRPQFVIDDSVVPSDTPKSHPNDLSKNEELIGRIPLVMVDCVNKFLKRGTNKGKVVVNGKCINRGEGYRLEIPCQYAFSGDSKTSIP